MSKELVTPFTGKSIYETSRERKPSLLARLFPSLYFYSGVFCTVIRASRRAKRGRYGCPEWVGSSLEILERTEATGGKVTVEGLDRLNSFSGPRVYVGNHMSTLETFLLPSILRPVGPVTFIVKKELLDYPVFGHVMRSRKPIALGRSNPREDLETVFREGKELLASGVSVIVFPQTTRAERFDPSRFNTIGAKLAARAKVPLVPVALKTDFWGTGKMIKDFGVISPEKRVYFSFGEPIAPQGKGDEAHRATVEFISGALGRWEKLPG